MLFNNQKPDNVLLLRIKKLCNPSPAWGRFQKWRNRAAFCNSVGGHHKLIMDKCSGNLQKALFFVNQVIQNGWSRAMLLNFLDTNLFERQGKAITNFKQTLPAAQSDLAQEIIKDPYKFDLG